MCNELRGQSYVVVVRVISVKGVAQHISTRLAGGNRGHVASLRHHCISPMKSICEGENCLNGESRQQREVDKGERENHFTCAHRKSILCETKNIF